MSLRKTVPAHFLFLLSLFAPLSLRAQTELYKPMIGSEVRSAEGAVVFKFSVDRRYHITDRKNNFFKIELETNSYITVDAVVFPEGTTYGDERVFAGSFAVKAFLKKIRKISGLVPLTFRISYQICQERPLEVCYAPDTQAVRVTIDAGFSGSGRNASTFSARLERILRGDPRRSLFLFFTLVFAAGFLTSLTPCVYPVIPIVMGFVGGRSGNRKMRGLVLSLFFVLGLSLVYSILGVAAALTGSLVGLSFQNPIVVSVVALIFLAMGLSMAGLFSIRPPAFISSRLGKSYRSEIWTSIAVGGVSALVAAPCVGPVLIALLSWITQTRNVFLGFWSTFVFSLGMSVIFLIAGTFSGVLSSLPRGGKWMEGVKNFFSVLLLVSGIILLGHILPLWLYLAAWGIFLVLLSVWAGLFRPGPDASVRDKLIRTAVVLVFLAGVFLLFRGAGNRFFPAAAPAAVSPSAAGNLPWLSDPDQTARQARETNRIVMVDAYAEWCAACIELDEKTFSRPEAVERLRDFVLLKLDFTRKSEAGEKLRRRFAIVGLPTVIFFSPEGMELKRFSGFITAEEFLRIAAPLAAR